VSGVVDEGSSKPASASPTGLVVVGDLIGEGSVQEQSVVGETPNLAAGLQALAAPDAVVIAGQPRSSERLPLTRPAGGTESSQTPRWREMDSNFRFLVARPSNPHGRRDYFLEKGERICWGTEGSNPSPSSGSG
jgi:hypothetical protein